MKVIEEEHSVIAPAAARPSTAVIQARGLQHFFGTGELRKQVLFDANLTVRPGEIIIMTGPSGSGKTTLLTLIGTLRRVQEGELYVLGDNLATCSDARLNQVRKRIGFIFQSHNLFDSLTATQNVRMALELASPQNGMTKNTQIAQEMLAAVGLEHRLHHKPKQLSGGQKQRVAIARGLVHRPALVLADEPTAALDKESGRQVVELLQRMAKEESTTIILVTHDNRILDVADRIVNLVDGRINSDVLVKEAAVISKILAGCAVFAGITPRNLVSIADKMKQIQVDAGDIVVREGEIGDRFYMIRSGRVVVERDGAGPVAELTEGGHFGETSLLTGQPRNATVRALEKTCLYYLGKADFHAAMAKSVTLEEEVRYSVFDR